MRLMSVLAVMTVASTVAPLISRLERSQVIEEEVADDTIKYLEA